MPPRASHSPRMRSAAARRLTRGFLDAEAGQRRRPGNVPRAEQRRIHDSRLTGVDLQPAREFPADAQAASLRIIEALADISPTLLNKYLNAAKEIADHAVLLPDGFASRPPKRGALDRRMLSADPRVLRAIHERRALPLLPYLTPTIYHRENLASARSRWVRSRKRS